MASIGDKSVNGGLAASTNSKQKTTVSQANKGTTSVPPVRFGCHSRPLRGLLSTPQSVSFEGRFGRMFPHCLPQPTYGATEAESKAALERLAEAMIPKDADAIKDGADSEESAVPALYTYLGQFIDHDITFDPVTTLECHFDPDALTDFRTPALDLDNVYGRGPSDQPYLYDFEESKGTKFLLGKKIPNETDPDQQDLQRNAQGRALIGDPRNDENSIISQFHALMLRFHNRVADNNPKLNTPAGFPELQRIVRWHYQWVVVHDFLGQIVHEQVLESLKTNKLYDKNAIKFYKWKNTPFMPVEYSAAAYRLGHSMVRPGYRLNDEKLLPIFPDPTLSASDGLTGFRTMEADRGIDWARFIDIELRPYGPSEEPKKGNESAQDKKDRERRLQLAYRIDTSIVKPLQELPASVAPDCPRSLAHRNLLRGFLLGLPTGQAVARAMGCKPLTDDEIILAKAEDGFREEQKDKTIAKLPGLEVFRKNTPLWTYILAEAALHTEKDRISVSDKPPKEITSPKLGDVGGRIVAETILGLLFADKSSFLYADPNWQPTIKERALPGTEKETFKLRDLVAYAIRGKSAGT